MPYATLEALRAAVPASGSTDHEDHTRGIVDALIDGVRSATVTLSSAQLLALHTTPVTLVAAPGAGKWVRVHTIDWGYVYGTAQYTASGSEFVAMGYGPNYWADGIDIQTPTADRLHPRDGFYNSFAPAAVENLPVTATVDSTSFTDGDGTLTVTVWYTVQDVP
jgi:hypothetical protein